MQFGTEFHNKFNKWVGDFPMAPREWGTMTLEALMEYAEKHKIKP